MRASARREEDDGRKGRGGRAGDIQAEEGAAQGRAAELARQGRGRSRACADDARVVYKSGANGLITDVQIQIGEHASARRRQRARRRRRHDHEICGPRRPPAPAARALRRPVYGGRAASGNRQPRMGSQPRDDQARPHDHERHAELAEIADQPAKIATLRAWTSCSAISTSLESQFIEHAEVFNAIDMGTGEAAATLRPKD